MRVAQPLVAVLTVACLTGCVGAHRSPDDTSPPGTSTIVVENRNASVVSGWLQFGSLDSVAGSRLLPNSHGGELTGYSGPIPETATMHLYVHPTHRTEYQHGPWTERDVSVAVKRGVPADFHGGVFWLVVEPDLSLRLAVFTHAQYRSMRSLDQRP